MTKQTKIILAIVGGILVLCLITCIAVYALFANIGSRVSQSVAEDPAAVSAVSQQIVDFDLPPGFQAQSSIDLQVVKTANYVNNSNNNFLMVMQIPASGGTNMVEQIQRAFENSSGRNFSNMELIEQRELTVRGQPASLIIQDGTDQESGERFRQLLLAFEGQSGTAMIAVFGPADGFDQSVYERMIESIR